MNYTILQYSAPPDWDSVPSASIDQYSWGGSYRPKSEARLCYLKNEGFLLRITSEESDPRCVYSQPDDPAYRDSCLEFFADFNPGKKDSGYLNFECNSGGALLCAFGSSNRNRRPIRSLGLPLPEVSPFRAGPLWGYELRIPLTLIEALFGSSAFQSGDSIKGNFFKCGDDTAIPHYGSWSAITNPIPNFHLPQYFGTLTLG